MTDTCYTLATEGTSSTVISFVRLTQLPFPIAVYNSPLMFSFKQMFQSVVELSEAYELFRRLRNVQSFCPAWAVENF
ncbi:MAG: hypothetical protein ACTS41_01255 [Candidatus Hodgkinia cicadicola]